MNVQLPPVGFAAAPPPSSPKSTQGSPAPSEQTSVAAADRQLSPLKAPDTRKASQQLNTATRQEQVQNENQTEQASPDALEKVAEKLKKSPVFAASDLNFTVDKDTGRTVIKITDRQTHELIRQIPSEEALRISKSLDKMKGLLFDGKA